MNPSYQQVFEQLEQMKISYEVSYHPAVYTIEKMKNVHLDKIQYVVKNLFLRDDKKQRYFLVVMHQDKQANLKNLQLQLQSRRLSFASEEDLKLYLGLKKGSVTPFGILNDANCRVEVAFDQQIINFPCIGVHPNENTATVWLAYSDLERVIQEHGNKIMHIEI